MSAPTAEVEAAQPAVVNDTTPVEATTQDQTKQEETVAKSEEQIKEEGTTSADAQIKQEESASKTEETAAGSTADAKMEDAVKTEVDGAVKKEESDSKPAPLLKTKAQLHQNKSNKKFDPSVLPVTNDPETIRAQVQLPSREVRGGND
jgi:lupus La protein